MVTPVDLAEMVQGLVEIRLVLVEHAQTEMGPTVIGFHGDDALELGFGMVEGVGSIGQVQERQFQVETSCRPGRKGGRDRLELFRGFGVVVLLEQCGTLIALGLGLERAVTREGLGRRRRRGISRGRDVRRGPPASALQQHSGQEEHRQSEKQEPALARGDPFPPLRRGG